MSLDEKMSDGIIAEKIRKPGQTSTIVFYLNNKILQYSVTEEEIKKEEKTSQYASNYFG